MEAGSRAWGVPVYLEEAFMHLDTRLSDVLHVLLHMAQVDQALTSEKLARSMGTNPAVFRRTMAGLRDAGIVHSERGPSGGWRLAKPIREITVHAVYEALASPTLFAFGSRERPVECLVEKSVNAALGGAMTQATALIVERFEDITLEQLMPSGPVHLAMHPVR